MTTAFPGAIDAFSTKTDGVDFVLASHINNIQDSVVSVETAIGQEGNTALCEGRLTLTSGTPVTTADVTGASTIYFTPFRGERLALHDGTGWVTSIFTELSIAVPNTLATMYDVFCYLNGSTPTLELTAWTNDTTRATAVSSLNGVYVKSGATTRRYLGSFRTDDNLSGKCTDTTLRRYLWNYYNRVNRAARVANNTSHTYNVATWRAFNNDAGNSQIAYITGVAENIVPIIFFATFTWAAGNSTALVNVGLDSTTVPGLASLSFALAGTLTLPGITVNTIPAAGYHVYTIIEQSNAAGTAPTFAAANLSLIFWG